MIVVRTDRFGETTAVQRLSGFEPNGGYLCAAQDGGYFIVGTARGLRIVVRRLGPAAESLWTYESQFTGRIARLIATADGGCLVTGQIPDSLYSSGLLKLTAAGAEDWVHPYIARGMTQSTARDVKQTADGGFILAGTARDYIETALRLVRTDAEGETLWTRMHTEFIDGVLTSVSEAPDHGYLVAGREYDTTSGLAGVLVLRADPSGNITRRYLYTLPGAYCSAVAACPTSDGGHAVVATADWYDWSRIWLLKTDAVGETLWTRLLGGPGRDVAADVKQTADGGFAITGTSDWYAGSVLLIKTDSLGGVMTGVTDNGRSGGRAAGLSVAPNPATRFAHLAGPQAQSCAVHDRSGRLVRRLGTGSHWRWDLADDRGRRVSAGVYVVKASGPDGTRTATLVVE